MSNTSHRTPSRLKLILGTIIFATIALAVVVMTALPGSLFYGMKVGGLEPLVGSFSTTPTSEFSYQITLLDRRVGELQRLSQRANPTPEAIQRLVQESKTTAERAIELIAMHEDTRFTVTQSVLYTIEVDTYLRAHERIIRDHDVLSDHARELREFRREVSGVVAVRVELLSARGSGAGAAIFLSEILELLKTEIADERVTSDTREQIFDFVTRAEAEIADNDLEAAIDTLIRAYQQAKTEQILDL